MQTILQYSVSSVEAVIIFSTESNIFFMFFCLLLDCVSMDELMEQVSRLSVSLSKEASSSIGKTDLCSNALFPEGLSFEKHSAPYVQPLSIKDPDVQILHSPLVDNRKHRDDMIVLSDEETEAVSPDEVILSDTKVSRCMADDKTIAPNDDKRTSYTESLKKKVSGVYTSKFYLKAFEKRDATDSADLAVQKREIDRSIGKLPPVSSLKSKDEDNSRKAIASDSNIADSEKFQDRTSTSNSYDSTVSSKKLNQAPNVSLKEIVSDAKDNSWSMLSIRPGISSQSEPKPNQKIQKSTNRKQISSKTLNQISKKVNPFPNFSSERESTWRRGNEIGGCGGRSRRH